MRQRLGIMTSGRRARRLMGMADVFICKSVTGMKAERVRNARKRLIDRC